MANTAITKGTAYIHGVSGTVTNVTVQSYTVSTSFANTEEISGADGVVVGVRYSDQRKNITIEGLIQSTQTLSKNIGDSLSFSANNITFNGFVTQIEERGEAKGFMRITITGQAYDGFTS